MVVADHRMGLTLSTLSKRLGSLFSNVLDARILLVGLDNAGKTTLLYKFTRGEAVTTIPTIGFNTEEFQYKNVKFSMWDVGGQERIRALWKYYYQGCQAIIFMVDSCDHDRLEEARDQLHQMLSEDLLRNVSVLVLANKQVWAPQKWPASTRALFRNIGPDG
jgi:small GTP-binding protein